MKRSWTALAPCPLAKTLIPTHPRRIYFYLTNQPHQPLPAFSSESPLPSSRRALISPSLSSDDDHEARKRAALSPSPEVDLSASQLQPDDDDDDARADGDGGHVFFDAAPMVGPPTPAGSFGGRSSLGRDGSLPDAEVMSQRAVSPPLERDEREFTRTASAMQSKRSLSVDRRRNALDDADPTTVHASIEDHAHHAVEADGERDVEAGGRVAAGTVSEDHPDGPHSDAAAALFLFGQDTAAAAASSPAATLGAVKSAASSIPVRGTGGLHITTTMAAIKGGTTFDHGEGFTMMDVDSVPDDAHHSSSSRPVTGPMLDMGWTGEIRSPEHVELQELEDLLGGF